MKSTYLLFIVLFLLLNCGKDATVPGNERQIISDHVEYYEHGSVLYLKSGKFRYEIPVSKLPFTRVMLLNASLVGYFTELGMEENIIGISSPEYVFSDKIHQLIDNGKIKNIGNEQKYDLEQIIALKPEVIFTNYVAGFENTYDLIKKSGIEIIFLDEYRERDPLGKSRYLLVFGKLLGKEKAASLRFDEIQSSYDSLKGLARTASAVPGVLASEMYGNQWFLPGGNTNLARFIKDANAAYINADDPASKAVPMSFEEVYAKSENAQYWVNAGNHKAKRELLAVNLNYAKMKVFQTGRLYTVTGKETGKANDYFESGVVRADVVLKDYIRIFHPELLPDYNLTYLKELK